MAKRTMPGVQEENTIKKARQWLQQALDKTNAFSNGAWKQSRQLAEGTPQKFFSDTRKLK